MEHDKQPAILSGAGSAAARRHRAPSAAVPSSCSSTARAAHLEALSLTIADVDCDAVLPDHPTHQGRRDRIVPLPAASRSKRCEEWMRQRRHRSEGLFQGARVDVADARGGAQAAAARGRANRRLTKRVYPHLLRHSFAT
ncbi:MAG: tyrosine-type recombinase/integrase, partial [Sandaracinaceae bacterium]|nr:tyrosine-type recombinase/integrase [Sandaracinaceae bacterium]